MRDAWRVPVLLIVVLLGSCTPSSNEPPKQLADDQTLRLAIPSEISLDPAEISADLEYSVAQNLYGGLYRFDEHLHEQTDLAATMPGVSADGLVYTIKLRADARFWDGHPVTADDVIYSWNRAVDDPNAPYASIFQPVVGYQDVQDSLGNGEAPPPLRGLRSAGPGTVIVNLSAPAGYFTTTLALPVAWVVNRAAVEAGGSRWSNDPNWAVGTGAFKLTTRALGRTTTLVPVEHWWRGSPGWLKKVEITVVPDTNAELRGYLDGKFEIIGFGGYGPRSDGAVVGRMLRADSQMAHEVHTFPYGRTDWIGFDVKSGPLAGPDGVWGRRALSLSIDRRRLAAAVCAGGILCSAATGGLISKGLEGYLGDGSDPMSVYDPKTARADLEKWDPEGTKRQSLTYVYTASALFRGVADNLRDQWKANLGIKVELRGYDTHTFLYDRLFGDYAVFRGSWAADYDNPQDWFDIFTSDPSPTGSGFADPSFLASVARADASSGDSADATYRQAGQALLDQAVVAPLFYYTRAAVVKEYVSGFGANALYAYPLSDLKLLQH